MGDMAWAVEVRVGWLEAVTPDEATSALIDALGVSAAGFDTVDQASSTIRTVTAKSAEAAARLVLTMLSTRSMPAPCDPQIVSVRPASELEAENAAALAYLFPAGLPPQFARS